MSEKKITKLPFEIDANKCNVLIDVHGISDEDFNKMFTDLLIESVNKVDLVADENLGKTLRVASVIRSYETSKGIKDIELYIDIKNIGKPNGEDSNQFRGSLLNIEFNEVGDVSDNFLDFFKNIKEAEKDGEIISLDN